MLLLNVKYKGRSESEITNFNKLPFLNSKTIKYKKMYLACLR